MDREETAAYMAVAQSPDPEGAAREQHLRHWAAEAMSIVNDKAHWEILKLCHTARFRPDCRSIAEEIGATVDEVNLALSRLLRLRLLEMTARGEWRDHTQPPLVTIIRRDRAVLFRAVRVDRRGAIRWATVESIHKAPRGFRAVSGPHLHRPPNLVQLFVWVEDVGAVVRKAEESGAKLLIPPAVLPEGEELAVLLDPQGMPFEVWRK